VSYSAVKSSFEFIRRMRAALPIAIPCLEREGQRLLIAHGALESGWGQKAAAFLRGFNFANITTMAGDGFSGERYAQQNADVEYSKDGKTKRAIDQIWRVYPNLVEAQKDYWRFLGGKRYLRARDILQSENASTDAGGFAKALRAGGYYTLPLEQYSASLATVLVKVVELWAATSPTAENIIEANPGRVVTLEPKAKIWK
jgi:flagellum-specific peptidoglycan hydrolase FlgJ